MLVTDHRCQRWGRVPIGVCEILRRARLFALVPQGDTLHIKSKLADWLIYLFAFHMVACLYLSIISLVRTLQNIEFRPRCFWP